MVFGKPIYVVWKVKIKKLLYDYKSIGIMDLYLYNFFFIFTHSILVQFDFFNLEHFVYIQ